nr:nodulation protein [Melilotus officinalis]
MQTFSRLGRRYSYDVFLNFRGIDTRSCFIDQLYRCLKKLFRCFKDNPELQLGDKLTEGLNEGIEGSKIFVVVISENYASSSFCLNELVKILDEFAKQNGRRILTVFYHTSPSDVLHQTRSFGRALSVLAKSATPESLDMWIKALTKVGSTDFSSWHIQNESEYECVREIVREVSKYVFYPIGLSDRVHKVLCYFLSNKLDGRVCLVGICGNPGIGKTTIASSVYCYYNTINNASNNNNFDYCCFIDKVEEYLSEYRLLHFKRKMFIVFEDVDDPRHLEAIVNELIINDWFGSGSKIVITARDKCSLEHHGIKNIYDVERFGDDEAYELLGVKIFNSDEIPGRYLSVFGKAKTYACGNPFHLELVGSYLGGKSVEECIDALDRFELIPKEDTKMILQMTFDALKKDHQTMLIDILDFKERDLADVEDMLRRKNGACPKRDIRVLLETSLISIDEYGRVRLHALTQDMVRDISHSKPQLSEVMFWFY